MMWVLIHLHQKSCSEQKDPPPVLLPSSTMKQRRVLVLAHSLLKRTEDPICRADPPHREVCCLPGAQLRDITRKLPSLVQPSDYCLLLLFHVGGDKVAIRSPGVIKRDFRDLGWLVRESGAQAIFSSLLPAAGGDVARNKRTQSINTWLHGWCH